MESQSSTNKSYTPSITSVSALVAIRTCMGPHVKFPPSSVYQLQMPRFTIVYQAETRVDGPRNNKDLHVRQGTAKYKLPQCRRQREMTMNFTSFPCVHNRHHPRPQLRGNPLALSSTCLNTHSGIRSSTYVFPDYADSANDAEASSAKCSIPTMT